MLAFHRLVAMRYFTQLLRRSWRVFWPSLVIAMIAVANSAFQLWLTHSHSVRVQQFRADYGFIFQIALPILILAGVLVTSFAVLIRQLTIFTTISVYGLFLGTAALVIVLSVMSGFEGDLKHKILGSNADIVITNADGPLTDYQALRDRIARVPGVVGASPYLENEVMLASSSNLAGVVVKGIDPVTVGTVIDLPRTIDAGGLDYLTNPDKLKLLGGPPIFEDEKGDDREARPAPKDEAKGGNKDDAVQLAPVEKRRNVPGMIIGRELAHNLRLYLGDDANLVSPFGGIGPSGAIPKSKPFRVAGIFFTGMFEYDSKFVYLTLPAAQKFFDQQGQATGIEAKVASSDVTEPTVAAIKQAIGPGYEVRDWKELNRSLFSALKIEKILMFILLCFIVLVAAFSIIANGTMLVMEKGKEIAILKAMGASDGAVLGIFMLLGLIIGGLGTISGIGVGIAGCMALKHYGLPLNSDVYYITTLPVKMSPGEIATVAGAALAIALAATLYPAWLAARLRPVDGLREGQR